MLTDSGLSATLSTGSREDRDEDSSGLSACSSDSEESPQAVVLQDAAPAARGAGGASSQPGVCVQGSLSVERCSNVLFGSKTIYNGPVTVVVADNKTISGVNPHALASPADGGLSAAVLEASRGSQRTSPADAAKVPGGADEPSAPANGPTTTTTMVPTPSGYPPPTTPTAATSTNPTSLSNTSSTPATSTAADQDGLEVVTRSEWGALPPLDTTPLPTPVEVVIIEHTVSAFCYDKPCGIRTVAWIQSYHMDVQGWADIAYHYLVASDGRVYEGRGWDAVGAIAHGWNWRAVGVAAIGDFTDAAPTSEQVKAMQRLLERGVALGKLRPGYRLYGKCQVSNKASPGAALMRELRTWSHWHNNSAEMHDYC